MKRIVAVFVFSAVLGSAPLARAEEMPAGTAEKLNKVLQQQTQILKEIEEIKAELSIIKVRATR